MKLYKKIKIKIIIPKITLKREILQISVTITNNISYQQYVFDTYRMLTVRNKN